MGNSKKRLLKILKIIGITMLSLIVILLLVRFIGMQINRKVPAGGINESMYVDINGSKQWISIYGKDRQNPVLLYLHGGPGSATSHLDYAFTRKWADIYTVVTWDQRNCGKSYSEDQNTTPLTRSMLMEDGKELTEFLLEYLSKDKLTILGHSWGSLYGANLVLEYPEYYDCFIGVGQVVDMDANEIALKEAAMIWAKDDPEGMQMVNQMTPESMTLEHALLRNEIMDRYGYGMMRDGSDCNLVTTLLFNPYYSLSDWIQFLNSNMDVYLDFFLSDELKSFSLLERYDYQVPFFNINGDEDYQANHVLAEDYFNKVNAPMKNLIIMEHTTHGLLESKSDEFSEILHQIANERTK